MSYKFFTIIVFLILSENCLSKVDINNIVYINGIQNTIDDAIETKLKIKDVLNKSNRNDKKLFSVDFVWNPIGWYGTEKGADLEQDKMELFLLKTAEEHFYHDFEKIVSPFNQKKKIDKSAASNVSMYLDNLFPGDNDLENNSIVNRDSMQLTKKTINSLIQVVKNHKPVIVIAHSQGNLLANLAYSRLANDYGDDINNHIRVINVANTSAFNVSGLNFTHEGDAALYSSAAQRKVVNQSLEDMPINEKWARKTPECIRAAYCKFTIAKPTFSYPTSVIPNQGIVDKQLDHSIVQTYLSHATIDVLNDQGVGFTEGANRFVDRFEDLVYTAAESLESLDYGALNDTGVVDCSSDLSAHLTCPVYGYPAQDAEHGLDAQSIKGTLIKKGSGYAGFDFTKIDTKGNDLAANSSSWDCVKDNNTGLVWEAKTNDGGVRDVNYKYNWRVTDNKINGNYAGFQSGQNCGGVRCDTQSYVDAINSVKLCGYGRWRLPTRTELHSLVSYPYEIDAAYFIHTSRSWYWTATSYAKDPSSAWFINFGGGGFNGATASSKDSGMSVRLVIGSN